MTPGGSDADPADDGADAAADDVALPPLAPCEQATAANRPAARTTVPHSGGRLRAKRHQRTLSIYATLSA